MSKEVNAVLKTRESQDGISVNASQGKTLLERAQAIQEYDTVNSYNGACERMISDLSDEISRISDKLMFLNAKIRRLEVETKEVTARTDPEAAARGMLELGQLYKKQQAYFDDREILKAEFDRLKALSDSVNVKQVQESGVYKLDGSVKTARALQ